MLTEPTAPTVPHAVGGRRTGRASRTNRARNGRLWAGIAILAVVVALVSLASALTTYDPTDQDLVNTLAAPSPSHILGTDELGRDVWSRLLYGGRIDLAVATAAVLAPFLIGTIVGAVCGYVGGWFDAAFMRIADIVVAFPFYVLVIALVFALGGGVGSIFVAVTLVGWVAYARIVRAEVMVLREREFVNACRLSGLGHVRILLRHLIPNSISQAVVYVMSDIVMTILVIVTLSYFGLGITPPQPDWGQMLSDGQQFLISGQYWLILFPGLAVVVTGFGLSLVGDGLSETLRVKR